MTNGTRRDELAQLRGQLATQQAQIAALQACQTPRRTRRHHLPRRLLPALAVALLLALTPLALLADDRFTDVPAVYPHHDDINLIADVGITRGCNPPANTEYCPADVVTRGQMASFLARTAGFGTNPPVVNARTAQTADQATNATNAQNAANAAQLNGQPASFYQPAGQPIANASNAAFAAAAGNATTVGGLAPNGLVRAAGSASFESVSVAAPFNNLATARWSPMLTVALTAPQAGYVLVTASINADGYDPACNGAAGTACTFNARLWDGGTAVSPWVSTVVNSNGNRYGSVAVSYLFPVTAGNRTFTLEACTDAPFVNKLNAFNRTLTALFVPFGGTGNAP